MLIAAIWALRRELAGVRAGDLVRQFGSYGPPHAALALASAAASFLVLGVIEIVALRQIAAAPPRVSRAAAMTTAFVANAFSQSVGLALLTAAAVRVRAYARYGLDAAAVARTTAVATLSTTLGLIAAGGAALVSSSSPVTIHETSIDVRAVGAAFLAIVAAYLAWSVVGRRTGIGRGAWRLARPSLRLAAAQIGLSTLDWLLTGTVLFAFLPAALGIGYWSLMRAYLIAQTVGVTSHVPAGAGVLELVVLALLGGATSAGSRAVVLASLVMFRVVYYLVPLTLAVLVAVVAEMRHPRAAAPSLAVSHAD